MNLNKKISRREFLKASGLTVAGVTLAACAPKATEMVTEATKVAPTTAPAVGKPIELIHWSWLVASDGEIWAQMIDEFNAANKDIQIRMEVVPDDQYVTKVVAAAATGQAPDFGWGTAGLRGMMINDNVIVAMDDYLSKVGLDMNDFVESMVKASRYPNLGNKMYMVPMDAMSLQMEVNLDHVNEAGLDINNYPKTNDELLDWADKLTIRDGDKVVRSGIMMTGTGVQPTVTWGIVAAQMGFKRASDDLKTAAINPDAGINAMYWVLDLFDKHKVSTRDIADRYAAFGNGEGSFFWTGPWTINGYVTQGLNFTTVPFPNIGGDHRTYFELGGLEMYVQKDPARYEATMTAIKWLSDNSFLWTTKGRGAACRKSILAREDYKTAGPDWKVRGAFIDGMSFATEGEIPVLEAPDFTIYAGGNFLAKTLETVWAMEKTPEQAMEEIAKRWQEDLDKG
ncbi:MAG: extracellular solute-binding protein [Anaerolineae bacterium]|jgi:ABC-type glycerol-3-phosphate transport system substrate-binding protein|nr:extracellular solute-binding protein [Anaerolineae bacterium]